MANVSDADASPAEFRIQNQEAFGLLNSAPSTKSRGTGWSCNLCVGRLGNATTGGSDRGGANDASTVSPTWSESGRTVSSSELSLVLRISSLPLASGSGLKYPEFAHDKFPMEL